VILCTQAAFRFAEQTVAVSVLRAPRRGEAEARLLVVEDEPALRVLLVGSLRKSGFEVVAAGTGLAAVQAVGQHRPDLVVLDVMLPDIDGFEVVRRLRGGGQRVPVVFLTAREATGDKVRGLTVGGDDYLTKPFSLVEVVARVRTVLKRSRPGGAGAPTRLVIGDVEMDLDGHLVRRAGHPVLLSATEFRLLRYFMTNANQVLSRAQILEQVWGYEFRGNPGIVEQYVSVLRRRLDAHGPRLIHTVRSLGYVLRSPGGRAGTDA
jgi:two-component system, OmpR family, response regulator